MKLFHWLGSLAFHGLIFFLAGFAMSEQAEFGMVFGPSSVEVDLVAAAPSEEETLETPADEVPENPESIVLPERDALVIPRPEQPEPPREVYKPKPVVKAAKKQTVSGDGSSPVPGNDAISLKASHGSDGVAKPDYFRNPAPAYPEASRRAGHQGRVLLSVQVNPSGRVDSLRIKSGSGYDALDQAALNTVRRWVFKPAKAGGIAVSSRVDVPIRFQLD